MVKKEISHKRRDLKRKEKDGVSVFVVDLKKKKKQQYHFLILKRKNSVCKLQLPTNKDTQKRMQKLSSKSSQVRT